MISLGSPMHSYPKWEAICNFFARSQRSKFLSHPDAIDATIWFFACRLTREMLLLKKRRKIQNNCSWPSRTGILQLSKTKAASSDNECMIHFVVWKAVGCIVDKHIFRKFAFTQPYNSWISRGKKDFELFRKFLLWRSDENVVSECGKKSKTFLSA